MAKHIITLILNLSLGFTFAQQWKVVGDTVISTGDVNHVTLAVDKFNTPYVAYFDLEVVGGACVVKKFDGIKWVPVGPSPIVGYIMGARLAFDSANAPFIAVGDYNNAIYSPKPTVKKFNGTAWVTVGNTCFTPNAASFISLKLAPDNTPYVAFRDVQYSYSASVMKFDGTKWIYVGQPGFSPQYPASGAGEVNLAIDKNGVPYVAFLDLSNNWRASVMKFNGTNWVFVGNPNISGGGAGGTRLVIDSNNNPIVAYTDGSAQVKKFNGIAWVSVGQPSFVSNIDFPSLAIGKNDHLYLSYTKNQRVCVHKFDGTSWSQAGNALFSPSLATQTSIGVDSAGIIYTGFKDDTYRNHNGIEQYSSMCVMSLQATAIVTNIKEKQSSGFLLNVYPNPTTGMLSVNYNPAKESKGILKITNVNGQLIYKEDFVGSYNKEINLSKYCKGIYFIEIKTPEATEKRKIVLE